MRRVFADSFYFFAILNSRDPAHFRAMEFSRTRDEPIATTDWVLTELADGLATTSGRKAFRRVVDDLEADRANLIVSANAELFEKGIELYDSRSDKQWSLTDCISFVVMSEEGIYEALTGDHHFEQAGFVALLK